MTEPLAEAEALTVRRGGRAVVDAVDLAVCAGEIVTLIGPNGSGKTTLVRAVLGCGLYPMVGEVRTVDGGQGSGRDAAKAVFGSQLSQGQVHCERP